MVSNQVLGLSSPCLRMISTTRVISSGPSGSSGCLVIRPSAFFVPREADSFAGTKEQSGLFFRWIVWRLAMAQSARKKSSMEHEAKRTQNHEEIRRWAE